mgnify:CR=1 FL=1
MNIAEMHSWFDILQMKGNNIDFTQREKDHILNRAQLKFASEVIHKIYVPSLYKDEKVKTVYSTSESSVDGYEIIHPLIRRVNAISTDGTNTTYPGSAGDIWYTMIESALNADSIINYFYPGGYTDSKIMMILGVTHANTNTRCRFVKSFEAV